MAEGRLARHLRRMRTLYAERQGVLVEAARRELAGLLDVAPAETGTHVIGWLPRGVIDQAASRRASVHGIETPALSSHCIKARLRGGLVLGYAALQTRQIWEGVRRLAVTLTR
jgi:GntR family transcriptional regulator / MocR family aminotransferase